MAWSFLPLALLLISTKRKTTETIKHRLQTKTNFEKNRMCKYIVLPVR
jgi:hypothetical protein